MYFFVTFCVLTFTLVGAVTAQPQRVDRTPPISEEEQLDEPTASRYQLALGYLRGMQFDRAIVVLRDLHAEYPNRTIFFDKLKESYVSAKRYEEALSLLSTELDRNPREERLTLAAEYAQLLYLSGDEPAAMDAWYAMVELASSTQTAYLIAYNSMIRVRLLVQAIDLLLSGRKAIQNNSLFQIELAYLYSLTGQHELATLEYLNLLMLNERQLNYVRGRLARDLQQDGAMEAAIQVTQTRVYNEPQLWQLRDLLAWLYEETGDFERAYPEVLLLEEHNEAGGQGVFQFALRAAEAGAFDVAGRAFREVIKTHTEQAIVIEAHLGIADMYRQQAERTNQTDDYQKALEAYEMFLVDFPNHHHVPRVMAQMATLYQDVFRNREAAQSILEQLTLNHTNSPIGHQAQFDLGRLAIEEGDLNRATIIFERLSERSDGELLARSRFELALIQFYSGKFAQAQSILSNLREYTDKEIANDAIALHILLLENPQPDSVNQALLSYADALLLLRQHKANETLRITQDILENWGQHPIADDTRFLRAESLLLAGLHEEAIMAFGEFPLIHPKSPFRDRSLFRYAEILETVLGDTERALQAYSDLLSQYPGSLLVNKVRERIRALREASI